MRKKTVLGLVLAMFAVVSAGGNMFAQDQAARLVGIWQLTQTRYAPDGSTFRPGDEDWVTAYHIEFRGDGSFRELNFWNYQALVTGTWTLGGNNLTLVQGPTIGQTDWHFIGRRTVSLNAAGTVLTMEYSRTQFGTTWHYTHTFERL